MTSCCHPKQAVYIGVKHEGPFKSERYRYRSRLCEYLGNGAPIPLPRIGVYPPILPPP